MEPISEDRRIGILVVGLGGANGVTLLAGSVANRKLLSWEASSPWGRVDANLLGCITQLRSKGGSGGYKERHALADFRNAAIGGWDIRPTLLGDALYNARILDYDLVRQVQSELNEVDLMRGIWNPDFIGESQHATALHVAPPELTAQQNLDLIRENIRNWRTEKGVTDHITVIWSASVERISERNFQTGHDMLEAIRNNDREISPSMLYAVGAVLEGCSFVNGGSQNTLCLGLHHLALNNGVYVLGTDFKAGQTKFKTAAVEYIRTMGLEPKVIASSNHLGNNDMKNLTSKRTLDAKMRVKEDIFKPWQENIDHQVRVMYTPLIGDEKRDIVEYTSVGFMNCMHTMVTYTRAMDSALCVPLMIDVAVWCDLFVKHRVSARDAAKATAYLFKVPEGDAEGLDPGFFKQMQGLNEVLDSLNRTPATSAPNYGNRDLSETIVCAGISCLDLQLCESTLGATHETINTFKWTRYCAGGSCPQVSSALSSIGISNIVAITKVGDDVNGKELVSIMSKNGVDCSHVIVHPDVQTALAVLPIYSESGGRGCFVNLAANNTLTGDEIMTRIMEAKIPKLGVFHLGYPHFLPLIQGHKLSRLLESVKESFDSPVISMDLNGVDNNDGSRNKHEEVLGPAYQFIDFLHANLEEAEAITGIRNNPSEATQWFVERGVKIMAVTMGSEGVHVAVAQTSKRWPNQSIFLPAYPLKSSVVNTNGAGDAFVSGMISSFLRKNEMLTLEQAVRLALLCAAQKVEQSSPQKLDMLVSIAIEHSKESNK